MGNLLKLLSRDDCPKYDVFVDFESKCAVRGEEVRSRDLNNLAASRDGLVS